MDISKFFDKNEKPLDNLLDGAGFCGIFRTIGVVGDSLSSGEFEVLSKEGIKAYHDFYEYSWGQYMARTIGCKVHNFSRGGMTAKEFCESFGTKCGAWDYENICQCYIIALGVNDKNFHSEMGDVNSIGFPAGYSGKTDFAGYYGQIICRLKAKAPDAKFFLIAPPRENGGEKYEKWKSDETKLLHQIAEKFDNTYVIDLNTYGPVYDEEFKKQFYLLGHLNPAGYILTAKMVMSYMDYIIRHNMADFKQAGLIGTPYKSVEE